MVMEKRSSKRSFLSFFDWNGKSQSNLFYNNPKLPDDSNQGKENRLKSQIKIDENGENSSNIATCDFNFVSSISIIDEECRSSKSLGLVAKLMGLDSLYGSYPLEDSIQSKAHKVVNNTITRFQNETLLRRSVKPISITHNPLLSPIKSRGYAKHKNALYIMGVEDAKIIEASPQLYMKNIMSSVEPLSVAFRTFELQQKLEAAQQSNVNAESTEIERRSNLCRSNPTSKGSRDSENGKGKSVSVVTTSKTKVRSREMLRLNENRRYMRQKICNGPKSNVLRKISVIRKGRSTSKVDTNKQIQIYSSKRLTRTRKTTNKGAVKFNIGCKRSNPRVTDKQKEFSGSKRKGSSSEKKGYKSKDDQNDKRDSDNAVITYENKSIKCNVTVDESTYNQTFSMNKSMDVVSYAFTSPLRRNMSESQSTTEQVIETRTKIDVNSFGHIDKVYLHKLSLSPTKLQVMDGDTLSEHESSFHQKMLSGKFYDNFCSSSHNMVLNMNQQLQISEQMDDPSCSGNNESENDLCSQHSRTITTSENPFINKSYLDSEESSTCGGSTAYSSMQDERVCSYQINESISPKYKRNWSKQSSTRSKKTMELEYVKNILGNVEPISEELMMGDTHSIIMSTLFDLLENQRSGVESYEEYSKLERKAIFDCVSECLELKCRQVFVAMCKPWPRWVASVVRKRWLEEVYKEMLEFRSMEEEEVVVDELVSKDMSTSLGRWLNFDIEAFENGLEIERHMVHFLIDELVYDLWQV